MAHIDTHTHTHKYENEETESFRWLMIGTTHFGSIEKSGIPDHSSVMEKCVACQTHIR